MKNLPVISTKQSKNALAVVGGLSALYFIGIGNILALAAAGSVIYYCVKSKKFKK